MSSETDVRAVPVVRHSARRINFLKDRMGATRYLEIGVSRGRTFLNVQITEKTAVDPQFKFEWQPLQTDQVRFFEQPSDEWFLQHSEGRIFDIIFLDGLHTFEQTFRDFCNSLSVTHPKTIWIIDDTVPSDIYSAWPDQKEAVRFRRQAAGALESQAWHGDVYKIVFAIHDFFPMMSFCTITTGGNPQTLVWRKPRQDFSPALNNLESISRLGYFDFKKRFELMNAKPEEEALEIVLADLAPA